MKTVITKDQAREMLSAPSGQRPRIYGTYGPDSEYAGQMNAIRSIENLDAGGEWSEIWTSNATIADIVRGKA